MPDPTQYGNYEPGHSIESIGRIAERIDREMQKFGPFGEVQTAEISSVISPKPNYEISLIRDQIFEDGSLVTDPKDSTRVDTNNDGEYVLTNPANETAETRHQTSRRGRYIPGFGARAGIAFRRPPSEAPEGDQVYRWGYFDQSDGFFFGEDADGIFIGRRENGTVDKTYQENWNHDKLDGSEAETFRSTLPQNTSGFELDLSNGHIFQVDYSWYGYGVIIFKVITWDEWNRQKPTLVHAEKVTGKPSVSDANLPISYEIKNNGTATEKNVYVSGRSYQILGEYDPDFRQKSVDRIAYPVGASFRPVISIRKKDGFKNVSIRAAQFSTLSGVNVIYHWRLNPTTLTNSNFQTPPQIDPRETGLEVDISATDITGGERTEGLVTAGGTGNQNASRSSDATPLELPEGITATLVARATNNSGDATTTVNWVEEW